MEEDEDQGTVFSTLTPSLALKAKCAKAVRIYLEMGWHGRKLCDRQVFRL